MNFKLCYSFFIQFQAAALLLYLDKDFKDINKMNLINITEKAGNSNSEDSRILSLQWNGKP